jgi:flagellar protein FlgJ
MRPDLTPLLDSQTVSGRRDRQLMQAAQDLEAGFIAEMLKSAGFGESRDSFGGGAGENGFASVLVNAQADLIVKAGGFGLAESIYAALVTREGENGSHD